MHEGRPPSLRSGGHRLGRNEAAVVVLVDSKGEAGYGKHDDASTERTK